MYRLGGRAPQRRPSGRCLAPQKVRQPELRREPGLFGSRGTPILDWHGHKERIEKFHARSTLDSVSSTLPEAEGGTRAEWHLLSGHLDLGRVGINALRDDAIGHFTKKLTRVRFI